ncbi:MAG: adenosylmethionine--8-amino-7-oxononanoate transaminase [Kiritimatiellae bacterium]|nr:adenosylmethionine--8-amino-7-oxononanoate transaminase [Kiritimatiellia bacterium]
MTAPHFDRHIWHPYTRFSTLEDGVPNLVRGEGVFLYDAEGHRYWDAIASWWCAALGHGHPRLIEAIRRQATALQHSILGNLTHPRAEELAARLADLTHRGRARVLFASDGASAVEAALKIALQYAWNTGHPERRRIVSLRGAYHGDTLGAVAVGFLESFHAPFRSLLQPSLTLPVPASPDEEPAAVEQANALFQAHRGEIAAVIVEPLCLGAAGMRMYRPEYLGALHALAQTEGALFIADEIAMGFGRTGRRFACDHAGITPDIVCLGKALTGGYLPLSATVVREDIHQTFSDLGARDQTFYHGHTFAGNPIAAACALEALAVYEETNLHLRAGALGARLRDTLRPLKELPQVKDVRQLGLIGAVELHAEDPAPPRNEARPARIRKELLRRRVLARPLGTVAYLLPPLTISEPELDELAGLFMEAVHEAK